MSAPSSLPVPARAYGALFRLLLPSLGGGAADDATELFADLYREARGRGAVAAFAFSGRAFFRLPECAIREHLERRPRHGSPANRQLRPRSTGRYDMKALAQDLRYAARTLFQSPGPTLAAVLTLAVAIGATATIFSVVDAVVLKPLPYPEPNRLVFFENGNHSLDLFRDWQEQTQSFEKLAAARPLEVALSGDGDPEELQAALASTDFLPLLGATPLHGRLFRPEEHTGGPAVALLSHGFWSRRFGADPAVLGRTLKLDGKPVVVAGVLSPGFQPPAVVTGDQVDVWLPLDLKDPAFQGRQWSILAVVARLKNGRGIAAANNEIERLDQLAATAHPDWYRNEDGSILTHPLVPLTEATVRDVRRTLLLLLGAVGLMLMIACANVANVQLARGMARSREVGLREALGASRRRVFAQLLTENVCLALLGGGLGTALAFAGVAAFRQLNPGNIPRLEQLAVDLRVLTFVLALSLLTGILFGILPAFQASRAGLGEVLKEGSLSLTPGRRRERLRSTLVVGEMALALVLLTGAGLLFRSLLAELRVDPGFRVAGVTTIHLKLGPSFSEEQRGQLTAQLLDRLTAVPGVEAAAAGVSVPFEYFGGSRCCWRTKLADAGAPEGAPGTISFVHPVSESYFETLEIPILAGRTFEPLERQSDAHVVVLNQPLAEKLFAGREAVGQRLRFDDTDFTVVGVVGGEHHYGRGAEVELAAYLPLSRRAAGFERLRLLVYSPLPEEVLVPALRKAVWELAPELPVTRIVSLEKLAARSVAAPEFLSALLGTFAGVALLLASGGVYATMLYLVEQRRREMGIRLALGASGSSVQRLVLGHGLTLTVIGILCGLAGALALTRLLKSLVWGISTTDAPTFAGAALVLGAIGLLACWLPAWKAARTNPLETLRTE